MSVLPEVLIMFGASVYSVVSVEMNLWDENEQMSVWDMNRAIEGGSRSYSKSSLGYQRKDYI